MDNLVSAGHLPYTSIEAREVRIRIHMDDPTFDPYLKGVYEKYLAGEMVDLDLSDAVIAEAMQQVPQIDA